MAFVPTARYLNPWSHSLRQLVPNSFQSICFPISYSWGTVKSYTVAYNFSSSGQFSWHAEEAAQQQVVHVPAVKYKMCVLPDSLPPDLTLSAVDVWIIQESADKQRFVKNRRPLLLGIMLSQEKRNYAPQVWYLKCYVSEKKLTLTSISSVGLVRAIISLVTLFDDVF